MLFLDLTVEKYFGGGGDVWKQIPKFLKNWYSWKTYFRGYLIFGPSNFEVPPEGPNKNNLAPKILLMAKLKFRNHFGVNRQPSGAAIDRGRLGGMIAPPHRID